MKPNWPEKTTFKFCIYGSCAMNLLVYFILESKLKNDFSVGPFLTSENGTVDLSRAKLNEAIDVATSTFLMDYAGSLDDCRSVVVLVESINDLRLRVIRLREFYPEKADALENFMKISTNHLYIGTRIVYPLPVTADIIEVELTSF